MVPVKFLAGHVKQLADPLSLRLALRKVPSRTPLVIKLFAAKTKDLE
jgi:hypothetical protein